MPLAAQQRRKPLYIGDYQRAPEKKRTGARMTPAGPNQLQKTPRRGGCVGFSLSDLMD
jgi:hypothetical protein